MNYELPPLKRLLPLAAMLFAGVLVLLSLEKKGAAPDEVAATSAFVLQEPDISSHAYLVKIAGEERILAKQRAWKRLAPASLTKILTAAIALEVLTPSDRVAFSEEAKEAEEKRSSAEAGETFRRDEAVKLALIGSFNDAALALAETVGEKRGGKSFGERMEIFRDLMNEKARELELANSNFQNPTGLDDDHQYSSAEDLARLAEYVLNRHSGIWEISRTPETAVYSDSWREYKISNTNGLLKEFPGILGGKTGFTDKAKGALLLLYPVKPNKTAVIVILGSENRFEDGRKIIHWLESINPTNY